MKLSDLNISNKGDAPTKRKRPPQISIIANYRPDVAEIKTTESPKKSDKSVTDASLERDKRVTGPSPMRDESVTKESSKTESVTGTSLERRPVRDCVKSKNVTNASLERDQKMILRRLSTQEINLLNYLFEVCSSLGQKTTLEIRNSILINLLKTTSGGLRSLLLRLKNKDVLNVVASKNGPSGWRIFELPDDIYKQLANDKNLMRASLERDESVTKAPPRASLGASLSSLSSSSLINTTTTGNQEADALEISTFKIPEELRKLGFSENHLAQLKRDSKLPLESILASIEALAYDLTFDDVRRKIRSPIGLIMKLLKAGELYLSEKGFESEADRLFRECVQRAEKQKEEKTKLMEKFFDLKFEEWIEPLATEDLLKISQPVGELKGPFHIQQLKEHFRKEVFTNQQN